MVSRFFAPVLAVSLLTASLAQAQLTQLRGPANYPPAGFTGQQFVDNDGCVYLRAGFGATVNWVPRVNASHRPLCNFPPTFGTAVASAVAADMAPDPLSAPAVTATPARPVVAAAALPPMLPPAQPRRPLFGQLFGQPPVGEPIRLVPLAAALPVVVAQPVVVAAPVVVAQPVATPRPAYQTTSTSGQAQCFAGSPRLETVLLRSGGTALVCTRGDGTLTGWRSPLFAQGVIGGALTPRMMLGATLASAYAAPVRITNAIPAPPKGYRFAWKDDRLNPLRGIGTAAGQAQQDQVWTRDIPAKLVPQAQAGNTGVSTMSAPAALASYVQVGTFGLPANAEGAKARLIALGLPVSTSRITSKGQVLQIVYAGPFGSRTAAQAALATTHSAGFSDAILK